MKPIHYFSLRLLSAALLLSLTWYSCSEGNMKKKGEGVTIPNQTTLADTSAHRIDAPVSKKDSVADGEYVTRYPNGVIRMKGLFRNGQREGDWACFFESGKVQSEGFFTAGKRDHHGIVYYENGHKMYEGDYKDGVQVGKWKYYKEDGKLSQEIDYGKKPKEGDNQ
jgi:antitoxin component YwqK of YwqJK toxin-antitoxin module